MKEHRRCLIIYTTATCNLNCVYCFIDKNPALVKIDQWLDDSFMKTPDYYIDFAKEMFYRNKLEEMQIWGGEPFLAMHRAYHTIEEVINYFPNFKQLMVSTNMVSEQFFEEFWGLIELFGKYPDRKFEFRLQLSCDGPTNINDSNRGEGVTAKIIDVFHKMVDEMPNHIPDNLTIRAHMKPTLDSSSIAELQTKEKIYDYFSFFENFYKYYLENNKKKNFVYTLPIPNTACPSPHTKADGIRFANYCKLCQEIEKDKILNYYKYITSFVRKKNSSGPALNGTCQGHCGNGRGSVGLLPDNMVSCCHNGFVDMLSEYKKNVIAGNSTHMDNVTIEKGIFNNQRNSLIFKKDSKEFELYQQKLEEFYNQDNTMKITNVASMILLLARNGQIDAKYCSKEEAVKGAIFVLSSTAYCVRDNLSVTGSIYMYPVGLIKILLNGAREYIEQHQR